MVKLECFFWRFCGARKNPLHGQKLEVFCAFWCKNSSFFAFLTFPDEPSAGLGVVKVRIDLWQLSRGLRGRSPSRAVAGLILARSAAALAAKSGI